MKINLIFVLIQGRESILKTIKRKCAVGFEEKNDALVMLIPLTSGQGIEIELSSPVEKQYGEHLESLILNTITEAGYSDLKVTVLDKGAWDYTLQARIVTALNRGNEE